MLKTESETGERRFFSLVSHALRAYEAARFARVRLLRHALPILRKKTDCFAVYWNLKKSIYIFFSRISNIHNFRGNLTNKVFPEEPVILLFVKLAGPVQEPRFTSFMAMSSYQQSISGLSRSQAHCNHLQDIFTGRCDTFRYHSCKFSGSQQSLLTETVIFIVGRRK